jgi:hypothetical protein
MKHFATQRTLITLALSLSALSASAQSVDFAEFERDIDGPRTQVLVLGSPHLSGMPDSFKAEQLEPLLERLARFKATGLDVPAALAEVEKTLAAWPEHPTPAQRRRLIGLFAAANDRASMVVQWLQLPAAERRIGNTLDAALLAQVDKTAQSKNENTTIAATLAARLGLQRVYAIDDHTADGVSAKAGAALGETMQAIWSHSADAPVLAKATALEKSGDMLATYRFYNSPEAQHDFIAFDFGAALKHRSPQHYGRQYVAWWETRNLRMVGNIRAAIGTQPGVRVLSIVGSSHKSYFDAYLGLMHDIDVEDTEAWLR